MIIVKICCQFKQGKQTVVESFFWNLEAVNGELYGVFV